MPTVIPYPKKCTATAEGKHIIPAALYTEVAEWGETLAAFSDMLQKGYGVTPATGERGGFECYFDASLAENEYRITSEAAICIYASAIEGLSYGLATALQAVRPTEGGFSVEGLLIEDRPDKDYRALMVDLGRQWHPFYQLLQYVDICFFYKLKHLHLHFVDGELYTLPSEAFPLLSSEGKHYTREQIALLNDYAQARGVVLVPEFECPGHATQLNLKYPEVFSDRSEAESGLFYSETGAPISGKALLCASSETAVEGVKALLAEIAEMFPHSPYIHIGGDEANIKLWGQCTSCRAYMEKNGIADVHELYSDYVARICTYVLSLGRTPIVWEGFPRKGSDRIPKETVVVGWECYYQRPDCLLEDGFRVINAAWKPLYIVPGMAYSGAVGWAPKEILDWNVYRWQHWWEKSEAYAHPIEVEASDRVIGASLCAWEMTHGQDIGEIMNRAPALAERTWSAEAPREKGRFFGAFRHVGDLLARIIQDR